MNSTWLLAAEKYSNTWTCQIPHFDHWTTSQMESAHSFIKSQLLGPNNSLPAVIKLINNALEHQSHKISAQYHQEKINSLKYIGKIFHECHGRITHYALWKAQYNFTETARIDKDSGCNGHHHVRTGIPCRHQILAVINCSGKIKPSDFYAQCHIN